MIVVTGATGGVGSEVVRQLHAAGHDVRAVSRRSASVVVPAGVEVGAADLADPGTLPAAFRDATAVFLYAVPDGAADIAAAARAAGVRRLVLLSSTAVDGDDIDAQRNPIGARHRITERAIEASGVAWTHLRPGAFATNARWWAAQIRATGTVRGPYPESVSVPIHEADIAAVAVQALTGDGHAGRAYPLSGPAAITQADQVRMVGEAIGRHLTFETISVEDATAALSATMQPNIVRGVLSMQAAGVGATPPVYPTVDEVTGKPARSFAEWALDHADDFR